MEILSAQLLEISVLAYQITLQNINNIVQSHSKDIAFIQQSLPTPITKRRNKLLLSIMERAQNATISSKFKRWKDKSINKPITLTKKTMMFVNKLNHIIVKRHFVKLVSMYKTDPKSEIKRIKRKHKAKFQQLLEKVEETKNNLTAQLGNKVDLAKYNELHNKFESQNYKAFTENAKQYFNQLMEEVYSKIKSSLSRNTSDITLIKSQLITKADENSLSELNQKMLKNESSIDKIWKKIYEIGSKITKDKGEYILKEDFAKIKSDITGIKEHIVQVVETSTHKLEPQEMPSKEKYVFSDEPGNLKSDCSSRKCSFYKRSENKSPSHSTPKKICTPQHKEKEKGKPNMLNKDLVNVLVSPFPPKKPLNKKLRRKYIDCKTNNTHNSSSGDKLSLLNEINTTQILQNINDKRLSTSQIPHRKIDNRPISAKAQVKIKNVNFVYPNETQANNIMDYTSRANRLQLIQNALSLKANDTDFKLFGGIK